MDESSVEPFADKSLGRFEFDREVGWKGRIWLSGMSVEIVLGPCGQTPSERTLQMARSWVNEWPARYPQIVEYIRLQFAKWPKDAVPLAAERFQVESIHLVWPNEPTTSMLYLSYPGHEFKGWHITFRGFEPRGLAYDD
jgi:hypothetical protein